MRIFSNFIGSLSFAIIHLPLVRSLAKEKPTKTWEALGPFPLGTRELPYIGSPLSSYAPQDQMHEVFFAELVFGSGDWPSAYGVDGKVEWGSFQEDKDGWVDIIWDSVDWTNLRGTEGWAGVQFMTLLRTSITIPSSTSSSSFLGQKCAVNFDLTQAHSFALIHKDPKKRSNHVEWHTGDIYAYSTLTPGKAFPSQGLGWTEEIESGEYWVIIKALYEIRMFGDPKGKPPIIRFRFGFETVSESKSTQNSDVQVVFTNDAHSEVVKTLDESIGLGDVVNGWIWGNITGLPFKAKGEKMQVIAVTLIERIKGLSTYMAVSNVELEAYQIRPIPISIHQTAPLPSSLTHLTLRLEFADKSHRPISVRIPVNHRTHWTLSSPQEPYRAIKYTFRDADGTAQYAMALPPLRSENRGAVLLATHGAGVEADSSFWTESIRRQAYSWIVFATGKTPWGYDYHGPSLKNVLQARQSLSAMTNLGNPDHKLDWRPDSETLLVGHSNGGQGAMYIFQRFPDMFKGLVSAAAYLKIQAYVGYSQWESMRWTDPVLMGGLMGGLSMWDNDIHASNAVGLPVLLVHGRDDDNVPVWHAREMRSLVGQWPGGLEEISLHEVPNKGHWFDDILSSDHVQNFLYANAHSIKTGLPEHYRKYGLTMTVVNPGECGSKGGVRLVQTLHIGRVSRFWVRYMGASNLVHINTSNVLSFSLTIEAARQYLPEESLLEPTSLHIDDSSVPIDFSSLDDTSEPLVFHRSSLTSPWRLTAHTDYPFRVHGPIIQILDSPGPLVLITPTCDSASRHEMSIARRIAHDAWVYARLDVVILCAERAREKMIAKDPLMEGSWIVIGSNNPFGTSLLRSTPIKFEGPNKFTFQRFKNMPLVYNARNHPSTGVLSLHPHPIRPEGLTLLIAGTDPSGLERAYRLFPVRTGTPLLEWVIIGPKADYRGAGGIISTGFWDYFWNFNPDMSWLTYE